MSTDDKSVDHLHYMLDTNTASYLIKNRDLALQDKLREVGVSAVCVSSITEAELLYGVEKSGSSPLRTLVESFLVRVEILPWDSSAALQYGRLRHYGNTIGKSLSTMDMLIAAHSMTISPAHLVTSDRAFSHFSEWLRLADWRATIT